MSDTKSKSEIRKKREKLNSKSVLRKIIKYFFVLLFFSVIAVILGIGGIYYYISDELPKTSSLKNYRPPTITTVYSDDDRKIGEFYKERRVVIPLKEMPKMLINAFIAAEDSRFYQHSGIDFVSIVRAFVKNLEAGTIVQGGSTITQQVTKSFLLTPERNYERKIKEAILAYRIDEAFTKQEILYLYLNQIYLGHGAYGVEAAAENYFGKSVKNLNLSECAILAGLPQAPSRYSPFRYPQRAKQRQIYVIKRMVDEKFITKFQATKAIDVRLDIKPRRNWYTEKVPCYTEYVRRYVEKKYGANALYNEGLKIYTSVSIELQKIARQEVSKGLEALDKRQGYRGPIKHILPEDIESFSRKIQNTLGKNFPEENQIVKGIVIKINNNKGVVNVRIGNTFGLLKLKDMKWARKPNIKVAYWETRVKRPGDVLRIGDIIWVKIKKLSTSLDFLPLALEQTPIAEAALLSIETDSGDVKAMIGGRDFSDSQFNRAIQSKRQPGSAFKPIIFAAALDKGYTPASIIIDSPVVYTDNRNDFTWKPQNYKLKFYGPTRFRQAIALSRNIVTIKILQNIGIGYVLKYAKKLGITSKLSRNLSIALGSSGISLLEAVTAYSVFANIGYLIEPVFITKITDRDGNILEEKQQLKKKVIDMSTAYIMTSLLESVVQNGTGKRIKALKRPAAGKTGTTNDLNDAWFVGYTPRYVTGVWVGMDGNTSLGKNETGSRAASPIWLGYMQNILKNKSVRAFTVPDDVVFSKIDSKTGLLPIPESEKTIFECFKKGTIPTKYTPKPNTIMDSEDFFKSGIM